MNKSYVNFDFEDRIQFVHAWYCCRANCVFFKTEPIILWA